MNILNLCWIDYAGLATRLTDAINKYTPHKARLLVMRPHRFNYPTDIVTNDPLVIKKWIGWADVINSMAVYEKRHLYKIPGKKLIWLHVGSDFRAYHKTFHRAAQKIGARELVATPDLQHIRKLTWLPSAVPVDEWLKLKTSHTGKPIVCQTPSGRPTKRTDDILKQITDKENIDIHIIEEVDWKKCMLLKSKADIYLGFFNWTYGVAELEAWSMGVPVISNIRPPYEQLHLQEIGYLPYYDTPLEKLSEAIDALISDRALYDEYSKRGLEYVKQFHDYPVVAKKFIDICEEL